MPTGLKINKLQKYIFMIISIHYTIFIISKISSLWYLLIKIALPQQCDTVVYIEAAMQYAVYNETWHHIVVSFHIAQPQC